MNGGGGNDVDGGGDSNYIDSNDSGGGCYSKTNANLLMLLMFTESLNDPQ